MLGAGALVVALAVSGGAGAGAQPGPDDQAPAAVASDAAPMGSSTPDASTHPSTRTGKAAKQATRVKIPEHGPGRFTRAKVDGPKVGEKNARLLRYAVKVERRLPYTADEIALAVQATLSDRRSWIGGGDWRLQLVSDPGRADFTIYLATPGTVDRYCWPLRTYGRVSCRAGNKVMLNAWRWAHGAEAYGKDVAAYREYLVNHEVGHRLGHSHVACRGKGKRAPVMMQQTKTVGLCKANPWPSPRRTG